MGVHYRTKPKITNKNEPKNRKPIENRKIWFFFCKNRLVQFDFRFQNWKSNQTKLNRINIFFFLFFLALDTIISLHDPSPILLETLIDFYALPYFYSHFVAAPPTQLLILTFTLTTKNHSISSSPFHAYTSQTHTINIHSHYLIRLTLSFSLSKTLTTSQHSSSSMTQIVRRRPLPPRRRSSATAIPLRHRLGWTMTSQFISSSF